MSVVYPEWCGRCGKTTRWIVDDGLTAHCTLCIMRGALMKREPSPRPVCAACIEQLERDTGNDVHLPQRSRQSLVPVAKTIGLYLLAAALFVGAVLVKS